MITTNSLVLFTIRTLVFTVHYYVNIVQVLFLMITTLSLVLLTVRALVFTIINYYCTFFSSSDNELLWT
jgi:hypothetical protein